jgi:CBS-domain-containing membrane protein
VLSEEIESVGPDTDVADAADLMASRQIRRLPVLEEGQLVGMVSLGDIAIKHGTAGYALEGVSEGVKATNRPAGTSSVKSRTENTTERSTGESRKMKTRRKAPKSAA